ncbi:Sodium Channel Protein Type 5 Subunit Alpha [Manis pentadactyla]|nr:Sodium Channel Protein Type 5 Subunit Alpha [Manis pentadactyla]
MAYRVLLLTKALEEAVRAAGSWSPHYPAVRPRPSRTLRRPGESLPQDVSMKSCFQACPVPLPVSTGAEMKMWSGKRETCHSSRWSLWKHMERTAELGPLSRLHGTPHTC